MSNLERVRRLLGILTPEELQTLHEDVEALLAANDPTGSELPPAERLGHVELKMINGYGPYKYLRRLEGGKLRSIYLGKASEGDVKRYSPRRKRKTP